MTILRTLCDLALNLIAGLAIVAGCAFFSYGMTSFGNSLAESSRYQEATARHQAMSALYGSVRWSAVVEAVNQKRITACSLLPKKKQSVEACKV